MKNRIGNYFIPAFVLSVYLFLYMPIVILVLFSFNDSSVTYNWNGFTMKWYNQLFYSPEIWNALKNSLIVASCAVVLSITMGTLLIWFLSKKFYKLLSLFYATIMIPDIVIAVGMLSLFSLFFVPLGLNTLIAGHTLLGLGFVVPLLYARISELDYNIIEASWDLGATDWQTFLYIVLPFLSPALVSSAISVFILSLDDFLISFFCAGSDSQTLSLYIYAMIRSGVSPVVNALSTLILVISTLLVLVFSFSRIKTAVRR